MLIKFYTSDTWLIFWKVSFKDIKNYLNENFNNRAGNEEEVSSSEVLKITLKMISLICITRFWVSQVTSFSTGIPSRKLTSYSRSWQEWLIHPGWIGIYREDSCICIPSNWLSILKPFLLPSWCYYMHFSFQPDSFTCLETLDLPKVTQLWPTRVWQVHLLLLSGLVPSLPVGCRCPKWLFFKGI